jgi:hypothetical protein
MLFYDLAIFYNVIYEQAFTIKDGGKTLTWASPRQASKWTYNKDVGVVGSIVTPFYDFMIFSIMLAMSKDTMKDGKH